ncbi:MAG: hypothetical protein NVS3B14_12840 [Ktedonobacteraceae bacterium]
MIDSPSPTQQPPEQDELEKRIVRNTLAKRRAGQTPLALFVKAIFRPIFKGIYYLLRAIRGHKLITLLVIVLVLGSSTVVNFFETGQWPLGIGYDQFNFHIHGTNGGGDQVKNWLYALRDGDAETLAFLDRFIASPPDPQQLVSQLSQKQAHLSWKTINVVGVSQESDSTIDSLVEVDLSTSGPGGSVSGYLLFHFVTVAQQGGVIIGVDVLPARASQ